MRLLSLHLEKFGRFTDRRVAFRPDAKLHLVLGPNEAGKSSALTAIHNLLFGVPERTSHDFLHKTSELRLGGEILARDGRRLAFTRRKGRKRVLFEPNGGELADDALAPFLGGLTDEVFTRAFGLDADGLRGGARELLSNRGEVGASLMAAGSGLRGLTSLRDELDAEGDSLFAQRASKDRLIYQILERHDAARRRVTELELGAAKWKKLNEDIAQHEKDLEQVAARRRDVSVRSNRLTRLAALRPLVSRIDLEEAALRALGVLPDFRRGFGAELNAARERVNETAKSMTDAEEALREIRHELASIYVDRPLLTRGGEIVSLFRRIGAYQQAQRDLPRIRTESAGYESALASKAAALGLASTADIMDRQPTDPARARIATLIKAGAEIDAQWAELTRALAAEHESLATLESARYARGPIVDPSPLREKLAALGEVSSLVEHTRQAEARLQLETRALAEDAKRLSPPVKDIDTFASSALPGAATLARFRKEIDDAHESVRAASQQLASLRLEIAVATAKIEELAGDGHIPSPERIRDARHRRDAAFAPVRAAAFAEDDAPSGANLASAVAQFETAIIDADRIADDGAREATRVAAWANARLALAENERPSAEAETVLARARENLLRHESDWRALWAPLAVAPLPPVEMTGWLASVGALLQRRAKIEAEQARLGVMQADIARLEAPLAALAVEAGLSPMAGLDPARTAMRVADRIKALSEPWDAARGDARARVELQGRIDRLTRQREQLETRRNEWARDWEDALLAIDLRAAATLEEARVVLKIWEETPQLLREQDNRLKRIGGMIRDTEAFDAEARAIVEEVAPALLTLAYSDAIEALNKKLGEAQRAEALHAQVVKRETTAVASLERVREAHARARDALASLAEMAPEGLDLDALATGLTRRDQHLGELEKLRAQLTEQPGAPDEAHLRAELDGFDADGAEAECTQLIEEEQRLAQHSNEIYATKREFEKQRTDWERGVGAEVAEQQVRNAEAELREAAHEWAVLKIGAKLLSRALIKHRDTRRDPLISRASEFFCRLTGGGFVGIGQDDDHDPPRFEVTRANGSRVHVDGEKGADRSPLSTGTLDQLYLALRLAYIEDYCARAEPAPFIGDDLFASFDDARTGFGIDALAELSAVTQPILFTHHRHVVDIARARIGDGLDVIEIS